MTHRLYQSLPDDSTNLPSSAMILERYSSTLKALSTLNSVVHDQGVAYAINTLAKNSDSGSSKKAGNNELQLSRFAKLLGREDVEALLAGGSKKSTKGKGGTSDNAADNVVASLLPPRVALENADIRTS